MDAPRLLFLPVSGPRGMGEYARALALAHAVAERWPAARIHFALSRAAPYAAQTPFPATLLPASPTFHPREVAALIDAQRPHVVVFDNAGRTAQLRAASRAGAGVVFLSSRTRQRRKAFRLRWMRLIDEHWIAYPEFIAGALRGLEPLKLRLLGRPVLRYIDTILPRADAGLAREVLERDALEPARFVLVVPGGGSDHPGAENAPAIVAAAAAQIAASGQRVLLVGVAAPPGAAAGLTSAPRMPMAELIALVRGAALVVSNGGDTLLQVLACERPCVAVPIAGDQAHRIERCAARGLVIASPLEADALAARALALLDDEPQRAALVGRLRTAGITDGLGVMLERLQSLLIERGAAV